MNHEYLHLFDEEALDEENNPLTVVHLDFISYTKTNWIKLFEGYDTLHAITFSSQLTFVDKVLQKFNYAEVIFGNESVVGNDFASILSYQHEVISQIVESTSKIKENIINRLQDNSLVLWVAKEKLSHEKIYLLSNSTSKRVITGSANLSYSAFSGKQSETISILDGDEAFDFYYNRFTQLRNQSTSKIDIKQLKKYNTAFLDNIENLPISDELKHTNVIEVSNEADREMNFSYSSIKNQEELKKYMDVDKKKNIISFPKILNTIRKRNSIINHQSSNIFDVIPALRIDYNNKEISLANKVLNLSPQEDDIRSDVKLFIEFMDGYKNFYGDDYAIEKSIERYYNFACWFFVSPFLSNLRLIAYRNNKKVDPFPTFGLLYGNSKAGKTSFLSTLLYFMIQADPKMPASEFKSKAVNNIRVNTFGVPIVFDDMVSNRFNQHAGEVIKNDTYGLSEGINNYPAIVISANEDVKSVTPDISRRTVMCKIEIGLDTTEAMKRNQLGRIQRNITGALYKEFISRILNNFDELVSPLRDENNDEIIDIFNISSSILGDIFNNYSEVPIPDYIKELTLDDYFNEKNTSNYAINSIKTAYQYDKQRFSINKKRNTLTYTHDAHYELKRIRKELPDSLEPKLSHNTLIMNLEKAKEFFGVDFKNSIFFIK